MSVSSKKGILLVLIVCIFIALSVLVYVKVSAPKSVTTTTDDTKTQPLKEEQNKPVDETTLVNDTGADSKTATTKEAYEKVLEDYKRSGYRIQISNCSGIPGKMNIKQGTKFMVDNRDKDKHTIKVASVSRIVEGYDYEIFTAPKYGTYNLTCDGKGSALLNVYP